MGFGLFPGSSRGWKKGGGTAAKALCLSLAISLSGAPALAADWSKQSFAPTGQGASQGQAAGTNSLAQNLSKVASVLSMAAGGLYMAKGAQQLKCCTSGCNGSGKASTVTKENLDENTKKEAEKLKPKRQPIDFRQLRFPDQAAGSCVSFPVPRAPLLLGLLRPCRAEAAGGCIDAMLALVTGGLMMLNGIMGLMAANQAGKNADTSLGHMNSMNSYPGANGTSPTPDKTNSALGASGRSGDLIKMDPALLRTGKANDIMGQFEKKFGISRDAFAQGVLDGKDPRDLLAKAPLNPLSKDDMNKATNGAKGLSDADKANALAGTDLSAAQKELAGKLGADAYAVNPASGGGASASVHSRKKDLGDDEGEPAAAPSAAEVPGVSPEVQAALAAKETEERRNGITDLSLFQIVHAKYRDKAKMIFGFDPDGGAKGVGNAQGM